MALQSSGAISLNDIHVEAGGTTATEASLNDPDIRGLINKLAQNPNSFDDYYGVSAETELDLPDSSTNINGQSQLQEITASDYVSSGGTLVIPSSLWIWSDSTSTAALTIDIPCTIVNNGKIIGKGGQGGNDTNGAGSAGGPAIKINSSVSNVTLTNSSGAYIAGGGGGGSAYAKAGGGGGAGGGNGGYSHNRAGTNAVGGELNSEGADGAGWSTGLHALGGEAGGGGGYRDESSSGSEYTTNAGAGGRILPGSTQSNHGAGRSGLLAVGLGGGAGVAGTNGGQQGNGQRGAGGGGWGAAGGNGAVHNGGAAGKAIEDSGNNYALTNNGTIYGATT